MSEIERLQRKVENLELALKIEREARDRFHQNLIEQDVVIARQRVLIEQAKQNFDASNFIIAKLETADD